MVMSWIWTGILVLSLLCAIFTGNISSLAAAVPKGAQAGLELVIAIAGSVCLWTGVGKLMEAIGLTDVLARLFRPVLGRLFPSSRQDIQLSRSLSANVCANFLGRGNAATPMGVQAACRLAQHTGGIASNELCRLIVMNTASIQLIPANVAAVRASLGCANAFDILPAVWVTSLCSVCAGLGAAWLLGKLWRNE